MAYRYCVFCDFDGTITNWESAEGLWKHLMGEDRFHQKMKELIQRDVGTSTGIKELFGMVPSKDYPHIFPYIDTLEIRPGFAEFLERSLPVRYFEDLKIPLYVVASNFDTGEYEVFSEGELIPRLLASCTIPVIFPPIKINGMRYVDGGLFMNLPVTPIRDICETVIGINVSPYLTNDDKENMIYVAAKSFQYIFNANTATERQLCDILLEIKDMESYNIFDLHSAKKIYHIGYRQMRALLNI